MDKTKILPGISVIICCYNSENKIGKVLEYIQNQKNTNGFNWEVVVVDNASKDNTTEVAKNSWTRNDIDFKVVYEEKPGLSNARIKGLQSSLYSIIVFVDDDNWLSEEYLSLSWKIMTENPDVGLAGGLGIPVSEKELPQWFVFYQDAYAVGPQSENGGYLPEKRSYLHGAGLVMRKGAWDLLKEKGFRFVLSGRTGKSLASGEDSEISSAFRLAGYKMWYDPKLVFRHIIPPQRLNWDYVTRLAKEFGKSYVILSIYSSEIWNTRGWNRLKSHNWLIGTAVSIYHLLRDFPEYLWLKLNYKEGKRKEFEYKYQTGILSQRFGVINRFSRVKKEIKGLKSRLVSENQDDINY